MVRFLCKMFLLLQLANFAAELHMKHEKCATSLVLSNRELDRCREDIRNATVCLPVMILFHVGLQARIDGMRRQYESEAHKIVIEMQRKFETEIMDVRKAAMMAQTDAANAIVCC